MRVWGRAGVVRCCVLAAVLLSALLALSASGTQAATVPVGSCPVTPVLAFTSVARLRVAVGAGAVAAPVRQSSADTFVASGRLVPGAWSLDVVYETPAGSGPSPSSVTPIHIP